MAMTSSCRAYKITRGLIQKYGPERVIDTPITEAGEDLHLSETLPDQHQSYLLRGSNSGTPNFLYVFQHAYGCYSTLPDKCGPPMPSYRFKVSPSQNKGKVDSAALVCCSPRAAFMA